ncbi:helix-turn-helix domain-containing protein [Solicola sp. PLA-1-18]|uniref:MmyB family transcriptional regulator n=1 Tax=Solicola sp. PLA-1-18 TaxID=3380532 RepID=UPI003B7C7F7D
MAQQQEIRDFLTSRRARLTPEMAGLTVYGTNRRVKGLRRDEVAVLSGISVDYYTRLERGNLSGVSDQVLTALAAALQLDEAERTHLRDLARSAGTRPSTATNARSGRRQTVRPGVHRIIDAISGPAYVRNARMDVLALNPLGRALFVDAAGADGSFNLARFMFLDERSRDFYVDWPTVARDSVSALRIEAGRSPYDRALSDLVGELSTRSEEFATWWAAHQVKLHRTATKTMHHPVVGEIELTGEALDLPGDPGLGIIMYTVEPASPSAHALEFLASWNDTSADRRRASAPTTETG